VNTGALNGRALIVHNFAGERERAVPHTVQVRLSVLLKTGLSDVTGGSAPKIDVAKSNPATSITGEGQLFPTLALKNFSEKMPSQVKA
jgi:hypothetical protein